MKKNILLSFLFLAFLCLNMPIASAQCPGGPDLVSGVQLNVDGCGTVPAGVTSITIETRGADGGGPIAVATSGSGATITGTFPVSPGDELVYLVGVSPTVGSSTVAGGGGGTAVINRSTNQVLIVAGGGGAAARPGGSGGINGGGGRANPNTIAGGGTATGSDGSGGGGFNANGATGTVSTGGQGFNLSSTSSVTGGTGISPGGAGAGAGGGGGASSSINTDGGGGGGYLGGNAGDLSANIPAEGGDSYVNTGIGGTVDGAVAGTLGGGSNTNGHVTFTFSTSPASASIPTLSEWGLIILALLLMTFGTLYLIRENKEDEVFLYKNPK